MRGALVAALFAAMFVAGVFTQRFLHPQPPAAMAEEAVSTEKLAVVTKDGARHVFDVEVADTKEEMARGLMFREAMAEGRGMLFQTGRPPREISFWMKNTLIPLDMIFVGEGGEVVHIAQNAEPRSLKPVPSQGPAVGVIEINGGLSARLGLKSGDRVEHPYFQATPQGGL
jgi:uncharacterized protein